mmetsp:Transcript_80583/g.163939  ORF Transcript_80583/g.163939 Transcript_80583/m.163939 type:complete len:287 (+) Transcript_80583:219-1079(+)
MRLCGQINGKPRQSCPRHSRLADPAQWQGSMRLGKKSLIMLLWRLQRAKELIHENEVVTVVGLVVCVVDGVVLGPHHRPHLAMNVVMDICRPHAGREQQDLVCQEVHGAVEQRPDIRDGLQDAINGMESEARKWRERVLLVVLVVVVVQVLVRPLDLMETAVHPVDAKLHRCHVQEEVDDVHRQPNIVDARIRHRPALLRCQLGRHGQERVQGDCLVRHLDLLPHILECRDASGLKEHVAKAVVGVVRPDGTHAKVDGTAQDPAAQPGLCPVRQRILHRLWEHPHH